MFPGVLLGSCPEAWLPMFPRQAQRLEHLFEVGGSPATSDAFGCRLVLHGRRSHRRRVLRGRGSTWRTSRSFFAWQAQHLEHLRLVLLGRRSTWSTFIEVGGSPATSDASGRRFVLRGRWSTWSTSGSFRVAGSSSFCVAGAALGAPQTRLAWQMQHLEHLHRGWRKSGDE